MHHKNDSQGTTLTISPFSRTDLTCTIGFQSYVCICYHITPHICIVNNSANEHGSIVEKLRQANNTFENPKENKSYFECRNLVKDAYLLE